MYTEFCKRIGAVGFAGELEGEGSIECHTLPTPLYSAFLSKIRIKLDYHVTFIISSLVYDSIYASMANENAPMNSAPPAIAPYTDKPQQSGRTT